MKAHNFLIALLIIPLFLSSACVPRRATSTHTPLGIDEMVISSFNSLYPLALEKARMWDSNASLKTADFPFWLKTSNKDAFCLFSFQSSNIPEETFFVKITETQTGFIFKVEQRSNNQNQQLVEDTIQINEIIDSRVALDLILEQGGSEFIQSNPGMSWPTILILEHQDRDPANPFIWRVTFINKQEMTQATYTFDAMTGENIRD